MHTTARRLRLTDHQFSYGIGLVARVRVHQLPTRAAHIILEAALAESGLLMYANGHNPLSLACPHDAVGWDHGSVGLLQQQVGGAPHSTADWGSTIELMNVATSADKFLAQLVRLHWEGAATRNWTICQQIQGSAFQDGSNYRAHDARAIDLGNVLWRWAA